VKAARPELQAKAEDREDDGQRSFARWTLFRNRLFNGGNLIS
jgi:hypothetical protein